MKKIIFAILVFSISAAPLLFPQFKNKIPEIVLSISDSTWETDVIFWETLVSWGEKKSIILWEYVAITLHPHSIFKLDDMKSWELIKWSVTIESIFDFEVTSWKSKSKLSKSSLFIKKFDNKTKVIALKWISNIEIYKTSFSLSNNFWITLDEKTKISKNYFVNLENIAYWSAPINKLINNELKFNSQKYLWNMNNISESFILFDKKMEDKKIIEKYDNYNNCISILDNLNIADNFKLEKDKNYSQVRKNCITKEMLKEENLSNNLYKYISSIYNIEYRYDLLTIYNKVKNNKATLDIEAITKLLNESIEVSDTFLAWFFIKELKSQIEKTKGMSLELLLQIFTNVDAISSKNIFIVNKDLIETRWILEDLILEKSNEYKDKFVQNLSEFHFIFAQNILSEQRYELLEYIFEKRIFFNIEKKWIQITKAYNNFINKSKILHQAYLLSKRWIHSSPWEQKTKVIQIATSKQNNEDKISELINKFKTTEKRTVNTFNYNLIKDRFANYWLNIDKKNITPHIKSWNTFTISDIKLDSDTYNLEYNYEKNSVDNIMKKGEQEAVANWSIPLYMLKRTIVKDISPSYISTQVASVFLNLEEKDFSYEIFLEKELIKKYLASIDIKTSTAQISKVNDNIYEIKSATINYKQERDIEFSFIIALNEWSVSNIKLINAKNQKIFTKASFARNLNWILKRTYEIMDVRIQNIDKTISALRDLNITESDLSIDSLERDWFIVEKVIPSKAGKGVVKWLYYAEKWIFEKATFIMNNAKETWIRITPTKLKNNIIDIKTKETERFESENREKFEFIKRFIDYTDIPDELINWDWITD